MAATITSVATDTSSSSGFTTGATVTVVVGDWLVAISALAIQRTLTFSDPGGNSWIQRASILREDTPGGTDQAYLSIDTCAVTTGFSSGAITVTFSGGSGASGLQIYRVRPGAGETVSFVAADTTGSSSSTTSHSAATVSVAAGNIIFGAASIETNDPVTGDSDVSNGSWSSIANVVLDGGTDDLSQTSSSQYKTVSGTGNQSWACTTTSARDSARSYLVLHQTGTAFSLAAAQGQYTLSGTAATMRLGNAPIVAGTGSYVLTGTAATPKLGRDVAAAVGSYSLLGTDATLTHGFKLDATAAGSYSLSGTDAIPFKTAVAGKTLPAAPGSYVLTGTDATPLHLGANIVAGAGSYALTGTDATLRRGYRIAAGDETIPGVGDLLLETGDFLLFESGDFLLVEEAATLIAGGVYTLTGNTANLNASVGNKTVSVDPGSYALTGTTASVLHSWHITAGDEGASSSGDLLLETGDLLLVEDVGDTIVGGAYLLTGTDATLSPSVVAHLTIAAGAGSYVLTGTAATLTSSAQPTVSPLHIGEWPIDKRKRRQREQADAKAIAARARFRRAIARLLEGLPPEFDEPEALDAALDNAVQAANLLYALSAPIREINAVNELIDHIRQLRIAQPIAQLAMAQAYNQAHRHLKAKAQEDVVMALLLGE